MKVSIKWELVRRKINWSCTSRLLLKWPVLHLNWMMQCYIRLTKSNNRFCKSVFDPNTCIKSGIIIYKQFDVKIYKAALVYFYTENHNFLKNYQRQLKSTWLQNQKFTVSSHTDSRWLCVLNLYLLFYIPRCVWG